MIIVSEKREIDLKEDFNNIVLSRINKKEVFFSLKMKTAYKAVESYNKFYNPGIFIPIPGKSFSLGYFDYKKDEDRMISGVNLLSYELGDAITFGWIYKNDSSNYPGDLRKLNAKIKAIIKDSKRYKKEVAEKKAIQEDYKNRKSLWKESCKKIKDSDKKLLENWKEICKDIKNKNSESNEDSKVDLPEKPKKSLLPEAPEAPKNKTVPRLFGFADERIGFISSWNILKRYEIFQIADTEFFFFKKRNKNLLSTTKQIVDLWTNNPVVGTMSINELNSIIDDHKKIKLKNSEKMVQKSKSVSQIDFLSSVSQVHMEDEDFLFEEKILEEENLVPLTAIKPMHAASILKGGGVTMFKEIVMDGHRYALKSALVKERTTKTINLNGVRTEVTVEQLSPSLGAYNMDTLELSMHYAGV